MTRQAMPVAGQAVRGVEARVQRDARADQRHRIGVAAAQHLGPADRELLAVVVERPGMRRAWCGCS